MFPNDCFLGFCVFAVMCVFEYVDDSKLKGCAKRAAWLGNDETHYTRKWEEKDVKDLKTLIELTQHWIVSSVLSERYISEMEPDNA